MSEAFCTSCGAARTDPAATSCARCGAVLPGAFPVPPDEAPTRIGGARPQQQAPQQQPWSAPAAAQPPYHQAPYQQSPPRHAAHPQQQPQQPYQQLGGQPQYAANPAWGPPPPRRNRNGLWIGLAALVLVVGGVVTALVLTLDGDDDGGGGGGGNGGGGQPVASDEEQIEQVLVDYSEATNRMFQGDETACDDVADLMHGDDPIDVESCKNSLEGPRYDGSSEIEFRYQDSTIDGDTAVVDVEMEFTIDNGTPTTSEDQLDMVKVDDEWKIDFEATGSQDEPGVP